MLRSKGIICTGCAACDSIYKRTSHASQETKRSQTRSTEATPWDALSLACSWILLVHFILHIVSAYQRLERKPHPLSIHWQGNQASYSWKEKSQLICFPSSTPLFVWSSSMMVPMPTMKQACFDVPYIHSTARTSDSWRYMADVQLESVLPVTVGRDILPELFVF